MHKRIQELARQAGAIKCHGYIPHPELDGHLIWVADATLDTKKMDAEKFAELIVKECATIVFNSHPDDLPFVGGKMLVHFGIKE